MQILRRSSSPETVGSERDRLRVSFPGGVVRSRGELFCLAKCGTALAWMLVSPVDRATLPDLWSNPICLVVGTRRPHGGIAAQPADLCLLCRNHYPEPLLRRRFAFPISEAAASRPAI